ncbi:MAG: hypothetical protein IPH20_18935 [Bacteroidales bacterium]|nr:hypothetical protein [Bacteroidales bacterium]
MLNLNATHQAKLVKVNYTTITGTGNFAAVANYPLTDPSGTGRDAYALRRLELHRNAHSSRSPEFNRSSTTIWISYAIDPQGII